MMTQTYDDNNESVFSNQSYDSAGGGFAIIDDEDINSLLSGANAYVETTENDDSSALFGGVETHEEPDRPSAPVGRELEPEVESEERATVEPAVEDSDDFVFADVAPYEDIAPSFEEPVEAPIASPVEESFEEFDESSFQERVEEPEVIPPTELSVPVAVSAPVEKKEEAVVKKIHIPTLADDLHKVRQTIAILDAYRALSKEEQVIVSQFVANGEVAESEADFIMRVVNVDPMLKFTMKALTEAKALDDVERSFYIIELPDDVLYSLGSLVGVFIDEERPTNEGKGRYARQLVRDISVLDSKSMGFVVATQSIFAAAEVGDSK